MRQQNLARKRPIAGTVEALSCPKCGAGLPFVRRGAMQIDACGFESYHLECDSCNARLAGIVDPCDEALLLSELAS
jgi:hypothetical protein